MLIKNGLILGWKGQASGADPNVIGALVLPLEAPSVFRTVHDDRHTHLGPPPLEGEVLHERFWMMLRCVPPERVLAVPVILGKRVVQVIYTHDETGHGLPDSAERDVTQLATALASAYVRSMR